MGGTYGMLNMAGNVLEWTSSLWGMSLAKPDFGYPHPDPPDAREKIRMSPVPYETNLLTQDQP